MKMYISKILITFKQVFKQAIIEFLPEDIAQTVILNYNAGI